MKTLTEKQYKKLKSIESKAWYYVNVKLKKWNSESIQLRRYQQEWFECAKSIGIDIEHYFSEIKYNVENGKDYSHGYNFWDCLA